MKSLKKHTLITTLLLCFGVSSSANAVSLTDWIKSLSGAQKPAPAVVLASSGRQPKKGIVANPSGQQPKKEMVARSSGQKPRK